MDATDHNSPEKIGERKNQEDPIVMYFVVRERLEMSIGKTAAQCSHAAQMLLLNREELLANLDWGARALGAAEYDKLFQRAVVFNKWLNSSFRKVVLGADEKEFAKVKGEFADNCVVVVDAGLTELAPSTETVIGLYPMFKSQAPKTIKRLQVLK